MGSYKVAAAPQFYLGGEEGGPEVRVLHLTDIHLDVHYKMSHLAAMVNQINAQHPDIVVFTGDFLRWGTPLPRQAALARMLGRIQAPMGKYAVRGNHDLRGDGKKVLNILQAAGFELLHNRAKKLTLSNGEPFWVAGLDDAEFGLAHMESLQPLSEEPGFKLLLAHEPVVARLIPKGSADLILAGHTHGGQIHLPKVEKFWMPDYCGRFFHGFYHVNDATIYVSAGLGESALPVRLFCPPEMPVFTIRPGDETETYETIKKDDDTVNIEYL